MWENDALGVQRKAHEGFEGEFQGMVNESQHAHPAPWTTSLPCVGGSGKVHLLPCGVTVGGGNHCWRWAKVCLQVFMHLLSFHCFSSDCFCIYKI